MRSSILAVFLLSLTVTCNARVSSRDFQYDVTFTAPLMKPAAALQQETTERDAAGIIKWHGKPVHSLDAGETFSMGYDRGVADSRLGYRMLPASDKPLVYLFLLLVFGFLFIKAVGFMSEGIYRLTTGLQLYRRVTIGLIFKTLPPSFVILSILFAGSSIEAQGRVQVGIGLLAGSTSLMLSLVLGASIIAGRCDLDWNGEAVARRNSKGWSLTETGVTIRPGNFGRSVFMPICVVLPYLVAQIPIGFGWSDSYAPLLLTFVLSFFGLYGLKKEPELQLREKRGAERPSSRPQGALTSKSGSNEVWLSEDGVTPNKDALKKIFALFDKDKSGQMTISELYAFILALGLGKDSMVPGKSVVEQWMKKFDRNDDKMLSEEEFLKGMERLYSDAPTMKDLLFGTNFQEFSLSAIVKEMVEEEEEDRAQSTQWSKTTQNFIAAFYSFAGIAVAAVVSIPLVECVESFSKLTSISPVLVSFVAFPLLLNFQEGLFCVSIASKKTKKHISIAFAEIFGVLFLNNFLPLAVFVVMLHVKGVKWDFLPEVLVILIVYFSMGILASVRTNFPLWIGILALLLYPVFIVLEIVFYLFIPKL